ncbi:hypothetical protein HanPSC8_Chr02g0082181 [Helianthus annuus]|nr:hypothetical protein HanPSC8_Chr02g0082181 [Helianthus annuus]
MSEKKGRRILQRNSFLHLQYKTTLVLFMRFVLLIIQNIPKMVCIDLGQFMWMMV